MIFFYKDYREKLTGKPIFGCSAKDIFEADELFLRLTGLIAQRENRIAVVCTKGETK